MRTPEVFRQSRQGVGEGKGFTLIHKTFHIFKIRVAFLKCLRYIVNVRKNEEFTMDKIFSARVDESVIKKIGYLARLKNTSKKKIIEEAIETYTADIEKKTKQDVLMQTHGKWKRKESPSDTVKKGRKTFEKSIKRHSS